MVLAIFGKFCDWAIRHFYLWFLVSAISLSEPFLCSYEAEGRMFRLQVLLLLAGTVLFFVQLIGSATKETRDAMGFRALDNLDAFFKGDEPGDRVA